MATREPEGRVVGRLPAPPEWGKAWPVQVARSMSPERVDSRASLAQVALVGLAQGGHLLPERAAPVRQVQGVPRAEVEARAKGARPPSLVKIPGRTTAKVTPASRLRMTRSSRSASSSVTAARFIVPPRARARHFCRATSPLIPSRVRCARSTRIARSNLWAIANSWANSHVSATTAAGPTTNVTPVPSAFVATRSGVVFPRPARPMATAPPARASAHPSTSVVHTSSLPAHHRTTNVLRLQTVQPGPFVASVRRDEPVKGARSAVDRSWCKDARAQRFRPMETAGATSIALSPRSSCLQRARGWRGTGRSSG